MLGFVIEWTTLHDAYGSAASIPTLLAAAQHTSGESDVWEELWSRLCHQGTVYTASYAALPALRDIAKGRPPSGYDAALQLAASIIASNDGPRASADLRAEQVALITDLRELAERQLSSARNDTEFIYGLQALMTFEDGGVWQNCLDHLVDGEMPMECPLCHETLVLDFRGQQRVLARYDDDSGATTPVHPRQINLDARESRMRDMALAQGRAEVARNLEYLFGDGQCPNCGHELRLIDALY
jgi:hypothetical protein